ncbi:MAG: sigma 54-interacting transcriptional regulator [Candidatus Marinimicrobia bacterium]|nr:sigma 54-interacting transcriptional regulator [Candidatus Neomarinimicrobiota bacterium]
MKFLTFAGTHDDIGPDSSEYGAVLTIFFEYMDEIDDVYIFVTPASNKADFPKIAYKIKRVIESEAPDVNVHLIDVNIIDPVDYDLVYQTIFDETQKLLQEEGFTEAEKKINITSGTPTMTACWILLQKSGLIPNARLIQSSDPKFRRRIEDSKVVTKPSTHVVNLEIDNFPQIQAPNEIKRKLNRVEAELSVYREEKEVRDLDERVPLLVGESKRIREIKEQILFEIDTETHVLILGEPGTGKEIVARSIWEQHRKSVDKKMTIFDCGQFVPNLIISELFGHKKGAFTGADRTKKGILEANEGRMIFLDEIGNIHPDNQGVFMRFLQSGEWHRVGDNSVNIANVQVIAATNRDIDDDTIFRPDLRDRFQEKVYLSPLRDRKSDIPLLVNHFLNQSNKNVSLDDVIIQHLMNYDWPGNVRELEQWLGRICRRYQDILLKWEDIPERLKPGKEEVQYDGPPIPHLPLNLREFIQQVEDTAIDQADSMAGADQLLGYNKGTLKQKKYHRKKQDK